MPEPQRTTDEHDEADEHDEHEIVEPVVHEKTDAHDAAAIDPQIERAEGEGMVTEHAKISATDPGPEELPHEPEDEPEPDHAPDPLDPEDEPDVDDR